MLSTQVGRNPEINAKCTGSAIEFAGSGRIKNWIWNLLIRAGEPAMKNYFLKKFILLTLTQTRVFMCERHACFL